ncbi:MAG: BT_2262 family domain-containing protein [Rikenellaceae bacterium]
MKKIILAFASVVIALGFVGCTNITSDGLTGISYHAIYTILGDNPCYHAVGDDYVDAGCTAVVYDEATDSYLDITDGVEVTIYSVFNASYTYIDEGMSISDVITGEDMGIFYIYFSYTNKDGFSYSESRDVYVYDPEYDGVDISGDYILQAGSYRIYNANADYSAIDDAVTFDGYEVSITQFLPGFFYVSDFIAGWYSEYNDYGSSYAMTGYATVDDDNTTIIGLSSYVPSWSDGWDSIYNATYSAVEKDGVVTKTISWIVEYAECMLFNIILKAEAEVEEDEE